MKHIFFILCLLLSFELRAEECNVFGPVDGVELSADFYFICQWGDNSNMVLEIATDNTFENKIFVGSSRWVDVEDAEGWVQFPMTISEVSNGTYYWRIERNGEYSQSRSFLIVGSIGDENYNIVRDATDYTPISINDANGALILSSLWMRSNVTENGLEQPESGAYNRGMVVKNGIIYISYGDSKGNCHIDKYDANTGKALGQMAVDFNGYATPTYPFSGFDVDDAGNVYAVSCGAMYPTKRNLIISIIDLTTDPDVATITGSYECNVSGISAISSSADSELAHSDVVGDISTGEFQVYTIINNSSGYSFLVEWTFAPGTSTATKSYAMQMQLGYNPRVYKLANNRYLIDDQSSIHPSVFNTSKRGTFIGEFSQATDTYTAPTDYRGNGVHIFTHGETTMMVYASQVKSGVQYDLLILPQYVSSNYSYAGATKLWSFPSKTLGNTTSGIISTISTTTDATPQGATSPRTNLYIYSSGNGLAAYSLFHATTTGVEALKSDETIEYQLSNDIVSLNKKVATINVYDMIGNQCASTENSAELSLKHLASGIYILNINNTLSIKFCKH